MNIARDYTTDYYAPGLSEASSVIGSMVVFFLIIMLIALLIYVWYAMCYSKIFKKMGEKGWKGFIPVYNMCILFSALWGKKHMIIYLISTAISIISLILYALVYTKAITSSLYYADPGYITPETYQGLLLISDVCIGALNIGASISTIWEILLAVRIPKHFGRETAFTFGLIFFSAIFYGILAFDKGIKFVGAGEPAESIQVAPGYY